MNTEWTQYVDAQDQLRDHLLGMDTTLNYSVLSRWPRRSDVGPLITITEITNVQTETCVVDDLAYQIDIWGEDADTVRELAPLVNAAVCGIGFRRSYAGSVDIQQDGKIYRKTFRFGRKVDKRTMRLVD